MDRFSEQLVQKQPTGQDMFLRGVIIAGAMLVIAAAIIAFIFFGYSVILPCLALAAGAIWLTKWLLEGTSIEYEYIVTNDDLDIDKIIGKRKRKRLVTVSLAATDTIEPYSDSEINADVTVMAHDETGTDMWYLLSDSEDYGRVAVIFNPDRRTVENIVGGFKAAARVKYSKYLKNDEEVSQTESDKENR